MADYPQVDWQVMRALRWGLRHALFYPLVLFCIIAKSQWALVVAASSTSNPSVQTTVPTSSTVRQFSELTMLGYVTPWNSRGKGLVEDYREKFDIIAPVWYTIHANEERASVYEVRGGPPSQEDEQWYKGLQFPPAPSMRSLQVVPRFILDGWKQEDYQNLVFNQTRWGMLSEAIMDVVLKMSFDGVVFESAVTHALTSALAGLSESLHAQDKILVLVSPPIRKTMAFVDKRSTANSLDKHNAMILSSIVPLCNIADYLSIMTYDMTGPGGVPSARQFPDNSQVEAELKKGNVREPNANTNADWVRENLVSFMAASDLAFESPDPMNQQKLEPRAEHSTKFLAGLPLYGYTYPVLFVDELTGISIRPSQLPADAVAILKGPGEPITMVEVEELRKLNRAKLSKTDDGEYYFDYVKGDGYWRAFIPTTESMFRILEQIRALVGVDRSGASVGGVAAWEVGQSSTDLLSIM